MGSGPQAPGMMTGVLQLCCSSASVSLWGPSAGQRAQGGCSAPAGWLAAGGSRTLGVAAGSPWLGHLRASFHPPHISTGFHGLIPDTDLLERKGT